MFDDEREALPFGDWDVEAVATIFESPWYKRVWRYQPASIAKLLRDLWKEGSNMGKLYEKLQRDSRDMVRDRVIQAETEGRKIAARIDLALSEMAKDKRAGRGFFEEPAYIVMSPSQVVDLATQQKGWCSASDAISTSNRTYKKLPIVSASGIYGPVVMTKEAFDGFSRMAPELDIRLR